MKDRNPSSTESATSDAQGTKNPKSQEIELIPDPGAPPIDRGLDAKEVVWEFLLPDPAKLSPEVQEAALTRGLPIMIRLWGNDLGKFYRLIRQSAIDEQIRATLDRQVAATAAKLQALADKAAADGQASTLGDALARELMGGIARQPHLVGPFRGVLQSPTAGPGDDGARMTREEYAEHAALGVRKIDQLINLGLPTLGTGRMRRIKVRAADRWMEEHIE